MLIRLTLLLVLAASLAVAQTASGVILGTVRDTQDAPVPGATVTVTNTGTNITRNFTTDSKGNYTFPFLVPGLYSVSAEAQGFRRANRTSIRLSVEDNLNVDFKLELGSVSEQITVDGQATLLDTSTNTLGQVIESKRIVDLPLNGRDPLSLATLVPGVVPVPRGPAPIHLGGSIPGMNGAGNGTSEVLLDGATDTVPRNRSFLLIHTPNADSVEEFKVQTNAMSAEFGRSNGGVISFITKSGGNTPHGTVYWFLRNSEFDANDFFQNRNRIPLGNLRRNQAGFTLGGPILIPKIYNGRNRTFFFTDYEAFRESALAPTTFTVPTALERTGDFSQTLNSAGNRILIYDPLTGSTRTPFAGNVIPSNRISPVANKLLSLYPLPNNDRVNGNLVLSSSRVNTTDTFDTRIDHNFTPAHRIMGRVSIQNPRTGEPNYFQNAGNPSNPPLIQRRRSGTVQYTGTLSPTLIFNVHYGLSHMYGTRVAWSDGLDITTLGFSPSFRDGQQVHALPVISASGYAGLGNGAQNYSTQTAHTMLASGTKIRGAHTLKFGFDYRAIYNNQLQNNLAEGSLSFGTNFTQGPNPNQASTTAGNGIATMLLGYPSGSIRTQPATAYRGSYQGLYVQDDWRATKKLSLNVGLRWEVNHPRTERYDRISIFDGSLPSPIATKVPSLPNLKGQMLFRGPDNRPVDKTDLNNFGPRFGLAYQLFSKTTIRTGYGIFFGLPPTDASLSGTYADGFTSNTSIISTIDGITPIVNLANPFPNGINQPQPKSTFGPDLFLGQSVNSLILSFATPYIQQWNFSLQQMVGNSLLLEAAYAGSKGNKLGLPALNVNSLTAAQTALGTANQQLVPNPFYGTITDPTSSLSLPTIQAGQLLRPFPQYQSVIADFPSLGNSQYHSLQLKLEKRLSKGYTLLVGFTAAKSINDSSQDMYGPVSGIQDPTNLRMERSLDPQDVSKRLVLSGVWDLPVGRGRHFGTSWSKPMDALLGGWQFNTIASFQSGLPLVMTSTGAARPNRIATGTAPSGPIQKNLDRAFDTSAFAVPAAFTFGNSSRTAPDMRTHGIANYDLSLFKTWKLRESLKAQFRMEAFNAFNRVQFGPPGTQAGTTSFGVITSQFNIPRQLQLALKIIF
ncbi:TonB-dependent receptor [Bryobacter aggregatus]|uniref:TonB-dependent receptor n=1 Tax=Bryobacter aggregatus TaxID=360054 RepID=UPI0004E24041|nr:TonB-dependent receptor [Bryobacter aggregatus]